MSSSRDPIHILNRMNAPTEYCYEPYSTQWRLQSDGAEICYVQISLDEAKPRWVRYGEILEANMYHKLEDRKFMKDLLMRYPHKM